MMAIHYFPNIQGFAQAILGIIRDGFLGSILTDTFLPGSTWSNESTSTSQQVEIWYAGLLGSCIST